MRKFLLVCVTVALVVTPMSAASAASTKYKITLGTDRPRVDVSSNHTTKIRFAGTVKGGPVKGRSVRVYAVNTDDPTSKRRSVGTAKLSSKGKYVFSWRPPRGGRWQVQVVRAKSGSIREGRSRVASVDAFHWTLFEELPQTRSGGVQKLDDWHADSHYTTHTGSRGTGRYNSSYRMSAGSSVTLSTVRYRCKKVRMHAGVAQSSRATTGSYSLAAGGTTIVSPRTMAKNDTTDQRIHDFTSAQDLTLAVQGPATFLVGSPKLFCTFPSKNL